MTHSTTKTIMFIQFLIMHTHTNKSIPPAQKKTNQTKNTKHMVGDAFFTFRRQRQVDLCSFENSLVYITVPGHPELHRKTQSQKSNK